MYAGYPYEYDPINFHHPRSGFDTPNSFDQPNNYACLPEIVSQDKKEDSQSKEKCRVCSLDAHGMHFGVMTCRPCAAFFRRIVVLRLKYACVGTGSNCNVDGRGRNVCRHCRFKKCEIVGMTTENVQYNRDSHTNKSGRTKNNKKKSGNGYIQAQTTQGIGAVGGMHSNSIVKQEEHHSEESCSGCSDDVQLPNHVVIAADNKVDDMEKQDDLAMDTILSDLKNLFTQYEPPIMIAQCSNNQLQKLSHALILYRQNQQSANQIKFVDKINLFSDAVVYHERRSFKFSKWVRSVNFFDDFSEDDKIIAVKLSFTVFDLIERCQMSAKLFGEQSFTEKKVAFSSYCAADLRTCQLNPQTAVGTEQAENYIKTEFVTFFDVLSEEVIKPLFELNLSEIETTFMLVQVLVYNVDKAPPTMLKLFDELREQVAADIHIYYAEERKMEKYSSRLLKMMNIVNSVKKIQADRVRKAELIRVFDIYKYSEKRQDFVCS